jgi:ATPase
MKIVPDTSIIIDRKLTELIRKGELKPKEVIIPVVVLDELQAQASKGREPGFIGLEELKVLREVCRKKRIRVRFVGAHPSLEEIKLARAGRLDALIRDIAKAEGAELITADYVQALVGEAEGVKIRYIAPPVKVKGLRFERLFTPDTISIHLKADAIPLAKRGKPGKFKLVRLSDESLKAEEIEGMIREITEAVRVSEEGQLEISKAGALVLQLGEFRISITRPPFSDKLELTVIKPIVKLRLEDYRLSDKLMERLKERAAGVFIAGPPGSGKTTFASSLADFYMREKNAIVKTLESPKELRVAPEITHYGPLEGNFKHTADILLLARPDYTIFDEVRKSEDFHVYTDLRLAGVGMVGVCHASSPIDAIQRFIGRIDIGMIPHVVDTLIFIEGGKVKKVYDLSLTVKVPTGMVEADLARPVVEVRDFETGKLEYEIYTYGEQNVVVAIEEERVSPLRRLAKERIFQEIRRFDPRAEVEIVSDKEAIVRVENEIIPKLIGRNGKTIAALEHKLGIHLEVEPKLPAIGKEVGFELNEVGNSVEFIFPKRLAGRVASVYIDSDFLFSATIGKKGKIRVSKSSGIGKEIVKAIFRKSEVKALI